jgi:hypothetical protein
LIAKMDLKRHGWELSGGIRCGERATPIGLELWGSLESKNGRRAEQHKQYRIKLLKADSQPLPGT